MGAGAAAIGHRTPAFEDRGRTRGGLGRNHGRMSHSATEDRLGGRPPRTRAGIMNDRPSWPGGGICFGLRSATAPDGAQSLTSRGPGVSRCCAAGSRSALAPFHCGHSSVFLKPRAAALIAPARIDMWRKQSCVNRRWDSGHPDNRAISITNALAHYPILLGLWFVCGAFGVNFGNIWQQMTT